MVHKELQQFAVLDLSLLLIQQTVKFLKANLSIQVEAIDKNFLYFHEIQTCTAYKVDDGLFNASRPQATYNLCFSICKVTGL